jgi:thiol-disulfide isomerase/thioredoxin
MTEENTQETQEPIKPKLGEESPPVGDLPPERQDSPSVVLLVFLILPLLGILGALVMIASNGNNNASNEERPATLINSPAPNFDVPSLDGQTTYMPESFEGNIVFINFWQTTCEPCIRELPAFADFADEQSEAGVRVLAINFEETSQQVRDFLDEIGIDTLEVALDTEGAVRRSYGIQAIPTTYIIAPDGTVRFLHLGELNFAEMEEYVELVRLTSEEN